MMRILLKKIAPSHEKTKLNRIKQRCKQAINMLCLLQKQHQTRHCILVIGQPESGKSALCASSGTLLFSSANNKALNEPAFEIYAQHQALFFHIPQDFFLFGETRQQYRAWNFLATQLKHQRFYLPITHCITCIDLHDFLTRTKVSNDTRLSQLALALNTLANRLKTSLDVSLFFTKTDLLTGFNEFFDHHNKEFLEQAWGISLRNFSRDNEGWKNIINTAYEQLVKKLNEQLLWRIHHEAKPEHLYLIKSFPLVMETIKPKLIEILPGFLSLWSRHRSLTPAQLYFVSCRQFRELKDAAHQELIATQNNTPENQKYFFTQQALKTLCQYRVTHTTSYIEKTTRSLFIILGSLLLITFISFTAKQFSQHVAFIRTASQTLDHATVFAKQPLLGLTPKSINAELISIDKTLDILRKDQQSLLIGRFIFSSNKKLTLPLEALYQHIVAQQWAPVTYQHLETFVRSHLTTQPEQGYIAFKIYLMLSQPTTTIDDNYIKLHLAELLGNDTFIPRLPKSFSLENNTSNEFIHKCREYFLSLSTDKLAYILLFADLDTRTPLNLATTLEKPTIALGIPKKFALISEIYTAKKFPIIYNQRLQNIATETQQGNWVLGTIPRRSNTNDNTLVSQLQSDYVQLYRDAWEQALKNTHLIKAETPQGFSAQLKTLASVDSPMLSLLKLSQTNTSLAIVEQNSSYLKAFNDTLTPQSTPDNSALFHSFIFIKNLREQLLNISESADPKTMACTLLKQEYTATEQNPTSAQQLRFLATQLPEPIQSWLQQLADAYYAMLNQQAGDCR